MYYTYDASVNLNGDRSLPRTSSSLVTPVIDKVVVTIKPNGENIEVVVLKTES